MYKLTLLLLLLAGDVEQNPGPPKKGAGPPGGKPKELTKEEQMKILQDKVTDYETKVDQLEKLVSDHKQEIADLKETISSMPNFEVEMREIREKLESISGVYDDLHEKMHDVDKTIQNNLLLYGLVPEYQPEVPSSLQSRILEIFRFNLCITRDIHLVKVMRLTTGPEVRGCRPVLISFLQFKDREEVLTKSKLLKSSNIYITEDLSRKTREHRNELQKYMRRVKLRNPKRRCVIRYDKLYIDNQPFVYDEIEGKVIRYVPQNQGGGSRSDSGMGGRDSSLGRRSQQSNLMRSESLHSVNGHPEGGQLKKSISFGSTESLNTVNSAENATGAKPATANLELINEEEGASDKPNGDIQPETDTESNPNQPDNN